MPSTALRGSRFLRTLAVIISCLMMLGRPTQMIFRVAPAGGGLLVRRRGPVVRKRRGVPRTGDMLGRHLGCSSSLLNVLQRGIHIVDS